MVNCQIKRNKEGKLMRVLAPNGKRSKLYESLKQYAEAAPGEFAKDDYILKALVDGKIKASDPEELALAAWSKFYTPEYREWAGDRALLDENGEPIVMIERMPTPKELSEASRYNLRWYTDVSFHKGPVTSYKGIPVMLVNSIINAEGQQEAAKVASDRSVIRINRDLLRKKFEEKAWTKPRQLKEVFGRNIQLSKAEALPEDQFKNYDEWERFVIEHEYQHTLYSRRDFYEDVPTGTKGQYETVINNRALRAMANLKSKSLNAYVVRGDVENSPDGIKLSDPSQIRSIFNIGRHHEARNYRYKFWDWGGKRDHWKTVSAYELEWARKKFPNTPMHVFDMLGELFGKNYMPIFGLATDSASYIRSKSTRGTAYHERFHVLFNAVFSDTWKAHLLKEAEQRYTVTEDDLYKLKNLYANIYDAGELSEADLYELALEEYLADEFANALVQMEPDILTPDPTILQRVGKFIYNSFRALRDLIYFLARHPMPMSEIIWMSDYGVFGYVETFKHLFKRPIPKFTRFKIIDGFNPLEEQQAVMSMASLLDNAIKAHSAATGMSTTNKALYNALITKEWDNNIFFGTMPYSVMNQIQNHQTRIEGDEADFEKLRNALRSIDKEGNLVEPGPLFFKVLRFMNTRGILILDNSQEIEFSQRSEEDQQDITDAEIEDNSPDKREAWQARAKSVTTFEKMGAELKFELNQIPVVQWSDETRTDVQIAKGYLGFDKRYDIDYVFKTLQKFLGNSSIPEMFDRRLEEAAKTNPIVFYVKNTMIPDNPNLKGLLFYKIGQKHKQSAVTVVNSRTGSKVMAANARGLRAKLLENIKATIQLSGTLVDNDGNYNTALAQDYYEYLEKMAVHIKNNKSKNKDNDLKNFRAWMEDGTDVDLHEILNNSGITISLDSVRLLLEDNKFVRQIADRYGLTSMFKAIAEGNDPIGITTVDGAKFVKNSGLNNFVSFYAKVLVDNDQDHHTTADGGRKYEWQDSNYVYKTINILKDKIFGKRQVHDFYYSDPFYLKSPLLNKLEAEYLKADSSFLKNLAIEEISDNKEAGKYKGVSYNKMSKQLYYKTLIDLFDNGQHEKEALFALPVPANAPTALAIRMPLEEGKSLSNAKRGLRGIARQEIQKITGEDVVKDVKNREKNKNTFFYITPLNDKIDQIRGLVAEDTDASEAKLTKLIDTAIDKKIKEVYKSDLATLKELGLVVKDKDGNDIFAKGIAHEVKVKPFMESFIAFHIMVTADLTHLLIGDPSYYKGIGDFAKRSKQYQSPGNYMDVTAMDRPDYNVRILETVMHIDETFLNHVKEINGEEIEKKYRGKGNKGIDKTDGNSYIDLYRLKQILKGSHEWNDDFEALFERLMRGETINQNRNGAVATIKPFYYALHKIMGENAAQLIPTQQKDSEFIILPFYAQKKINGVRNKLYNPLFREMLVDMGYTFKDTDTHTEVYFDEKGRANGAYTDKVGYDSTTKVGSFGITKMKENGLPDFNTGIRHKYSNYHYRKQQETPNHFLEDDANFSVQLRKHVINNLDSSEDAVYNVKDRDRHSKKTKPLSKQEVLARHNKLIIDDMRRDFKEINDEVKDFDSMLELIKAEIVRRNLGDQYLEALRETHNEALRAIGQRTVVSLADPINLHRIEALLNSLFTKKVITRRVAHGVSLVNASSHGFEREPQIVFGKDGKTIEYVECYAPIHSVKLLKYRDESGQIDISKIPKKDQELLEGFLWRVPNEDKYSSLHVKIIGFLPMEGGGNVILPAEITQIAGLDFDIDKMFGFFYSGINKSKNALLKELNRKTAEFYKKIKKLQTVLPMKSYYRLLENPTFDDLMEVAEQNSKNPLNAFMLKADYATLFDETTQLLGEVEELKDMVENYDQYVSDDKKLDLLHAIWKHPNTAKSILDPGNYDRFKNQNIKIINDKAKAGAYGEDIKTQAGNKKIEDLNDTLDFASPSTWVNIAYRMSSGEALIGIAANTAIGHAIMQHFDLTTKYVEFFDGNRFDKLNEELEHGTGIRISKNLASILAAFVDHGKDPQADYSNINNYTIGVASMLLLKGVPLTTVQDFLSHPLVEAYTQEYLNKGANRKAELSAMSAANISPIGKLAPRKESGVRDMKTSDLSADRKRYVVKMKDGKFNIKRVDGQPFGVTEKQRLDGILRNFIIMNKRSRPISNLVIAIKQGESGLGPTDAHSIRKISNMDDPDIREDIIGSKEMLEDDSWFFNVINQLFQDSRESILKNAGLPDRNTGAFKVINELIQDYKPDAYVSAGELDFMHKNFYDYMLSEWFEISDRKEYYDFMMNFPQEVRDYVKDNPDSPYKPLLERLNLDLDQRDGFNYIVFTGIAGLDSLERDRLRDTWEKMLLDLDTNELAENLIKYSYYLSGYRITAFGFSNLQPVYYRAINPDLSLMIHKHYVAATQIPYAGTNEAAMELYEKVSPTYITQFFDQFIRNHFRGLTYIPVVSMDENRNVNKILYTNTFKGKPTSNSKPYLIQMTNIRNVTTRSGNLPNYIKTKVGDDWYLFTVDRATVKYNTYGKLVSAMYKPVPALGTYKHSSYSKPGIEGTYKNGIARGKMITEYNINSRAMYSVFAINNVNDELTLYDNAKQKDLTKIKEQELQDQDPIGVRAAKLYNQFGKQILENWGIETVEDLELAMQADPQLEEHIKKCSPS